MKIAFDAQPLIDDQMTGVGFCEAGIVGALTQKYKENRYDFTLFRTKPENKELLRPFEREGGRLNICSWFPGKFYRAMWNFIPVPYRWFFGKNSDITHFFNYHVPPGVHGKKVATVHDMGYKVFPETIRLKTKIMLNLSLKRSCKRADKIITDSEFSKSEIIRFLGISPEKITVCPCGVDRDIYYHRTDIQELTRIKEAYNIPDEYFLYLGTLEPRKNIERLIEAYSILKKENPSAPALVLAGRKGWLYDSIFERVKLLELEKCVIFTGYVGDEDKPALLSGAAAFIFPSLYEGFGMPPLEAMACGTPVLTANVSSLPEVVGDAAVLVDPYSVEQIENGMKRLIEDEALCRELSVKGLKRAELFTWERSAEIVMGVYRELLKVKE